MNPQPPLQRNTVRVDCDRVGASSVPVDDIYVTLKDTDSDPDADLDIYLGTTRVRKARDIAPGRGVTVRQGRLRGGG